MGKLLCENNLRDVWCRNESVRAEIGQILQTHAAKLVVEIQLIQNNYSLRDRGSSSGRIHQEYIHFPRRRVA